MHRIREELLDVGRCGRRTCMLRATLLYASVLFVSGKMFLFTVKVCRWAYQGQE